MLRYALSCVSCCGWPLQWVTKLMMAERPQVEVKTELRILQHEALLVPSAAQINATRRVRIHSTTATA